ncbi:MAG: hypothetical protein ABSE05_04845 [Syntrophales bacterium]
MAIFRDHMRRLDLRGKPDLMLEGTIGVIQACSAYAKLDGRPFAPFLEMQRYNPARQDVARYAFTFDLCGKAFARVLVAAGLEVLDLADLYGHPWRNYKVCGYSSFWITHIDWTDLTSAELVQFESEVTDDLRYDYHEDDLDIWFDDSRTAGALFVSVQDREDL